jgi:bacteriocin-like protein
MKPNEGAKVETDTELNIDELSKVSGGGGVSHQEESLPIPSSDSDAPGALGAPASAPSAAGSVPSTGGGSSSRFYRGGRKI